MSMILKGIDMPKDDEGITIEIGKDGLRAYSTHLKEADVEAIQIPKNHGNIIDESKAVVNETIDGYYEITAPTILEAEGRTYTIQADSETVSCKNGENQF